MPNDQVTILMLQGPLGPFFADLSVAFTNLSIETHRVCFNKGDWHFALADKVVRFDKAHDAWAEWLDTYIADNKITAVCCYGDSRFYHREARKVCAERGLPVFCLEEGYVRPGFVTLEEGGNNANSSFPERFREAKLPEVATPAAARINDVFRFQFWFATLYYIVKDWRVFGFRRYRHHRIGNWATEMLAWVLAGVRKNLVTRWRERGLTDRLVAKKQPLFFVPLQVAVDAQMVYHSPFDSVSEFIDTVLRSFAAHAPQDAHLVIKHHPMDRGFHHYGKIISRLSRGLGCEGRVTYCFDVDLAQLLAVAAGCITVNSTVGLQALERSVPTLMLGKSMVADAGLTSSASLDDFWARPGNVDAPALARYKRLLTMHTQQPGSFYRNRHIAAEGCARAIAAALGNISGENA